MTHIGHVAIEAGDGREGLELGRTANPDAVLCDLRLPGMDGLEVLPQGSVSGKGDALRGMASRDGATLEDLSTWLGLRDGIQLPGDVALLKISKGVTHA